MRTTQIIVLAVTLLLMLAAIGCDDDCTTCPEPVAPLGFAQGGLILSPSTVIPSLEISGHGAVTPDLDSIKVGDSLLPAMSFSLMSRWPYADAHWMIHYQEGGDPATYMYQHGDTAVITVWGEGRSSSCHLKILDVSEAAANITSPLRNADTIALGQTDTVFWNTVDQIDYYAVMIPWWIASPEFSGWTFEYYYATDTFFVITGDMHPPFLDHFDVVITPFTGPDPRTNLSNWTGDFLNGVMYSFGAHQATTIHIADDGPVAKVTPRTLSESPRDWNARDIVGNVYSRYRR